MLRNRRPPPAERPRPDWALAPRHAVPRVSRASLRSWDWLLALCRPSDATLRAHLRLRRVRVARLPLPAGRGNRGTPAAARRMAARPSRRAGYTRLPPVAAHRDAPRAGTAPRLRSGPSAFRVLRPGSPWIDPRGPRRERHCWRPASSRPPCRSLVRSPCLAGERPARRNTDKIAGDEPVAEARRTRQEPADAPRSRSSRLADPAIP